MPGTLFSLLAVLVLSLPAAAQTAGVDRLRSALSREVADFQAATESRTGKPQPGLVELRQRLLLCRDRAAAEAWGKDFFAQAGKLLALKSTAGLGGSVRLIESNHRDFVTEFVTLGLNGQDPVPAAKGLKAKGGAADAAKLDKLFDNSTGGKSAVGAVYAGKEAAKKAPPMTKTPARQPAKVAGIRTPPTLPPVPNAAARALREAIAANPVNAVAPAAWSEALVRAWFTPAKAQTPIDIEYRFADDGEITGVRVPSEDYEETREFQGGLVRRNLIRRGAEFTEYEYQYNSKGTLLKKKLLRGTPDPLPLAAPVTALVLDWQISREDRLKIERDSRPKVFHSPFWDGRWQGVSRGYTDPDLPKTWKKHPILKVKMPHEGVDLPVAEGTKVYPSRRGKVLAAGWESGYGLRVTIQHFENNRPDGAPQEVTLYGHLSKAMVNKGQWVTPGKDVIGLVGSTGLSTGPHLHFEVRDDGKAVDPMAKLSATIPGKTPRTVVAPFIASRP